MKKSVLLNVNIRKNAPATQTNAEAAQTTLERKTIITQNPAQTHIGGHGTPIIHTDGTLPVLAMV